MAIAAVIVGTIALSVLEDRRQRAMATKRRALTKADFIAELVAAGVLEDTANFVWDKAVFYYTEPLRPEPADRWEETMRIDPEDLEDAAAEFWKQQGWVEPSPKDPVVFPSDPTLLGFAQWLDRQRQLQK